jgi:hypothetical protein
MTELPLFGRSRAKSSVDIVEMSSTHIDYDLKPQYIPSA